MLHALGLLLVGVVAASLALIALYAAGFVVLAFVAAVTRRRPDPLARELDQVLEEILDCGQARAACNPIDLARVPAGERVVDSNQNPTRRQNPEQRYDQ